MNDFTKEELQYLLEMIDSIRILNRSINDDELQEKIQSMIDNYCDHADLIHSAWGRVVCCKKCHKELLLDDNQ